MNIPPRQLSPSSLLASFAKMLTSSVHGHYQLYVCSGQEELFSLELRYDSPGQAGAEPEGPVS